MEGVPSAWQKEKGSRSKVSFRNIYFNPNSDLLKKFWWVRIERRSNSDFIDYLGAVQFFWGLSFLNINLRYRLLAHTGATCTGTNKIFWGLSYWVFWGLSYRMRWIYRMWCMPATAIDNNVPRLEWCESMKGPEKPSESPRGDDDAGKQDAWAGGIDFGGDKVDSYVSTYAWFKVIIFLDVLEKC